MKNYLLALSILVSSSYLFGQETVQDTTKKDFKNVISIDATIFVSRFFNFNSSTSYYSSPYAISYRRIFKSNAVRIDVGGNIQNNNGTKNDTLHPITKRHGLNLALGFEHYSYLTKRWNLYYGAAAFTAYTFYDGVYPYTSNSYREQSSRNYSYGISPLLGVQFKINSRLSISTETSYNIAYTYSKSFDIQPPTTFNTHQNSSGIETSFYAPTSINFRVLF